MKGLFEKYNVLRQFRRGECFVHSWFCRIFIHNEIDIKVKIYSRQIMKKHIIDKYLILISSVTLLFCGSCVTTKHSNILGYARNGYITDTDNKIIGYYSNGFYYDKDRQLKGTYRNGYIFDASDNIIACYSNGHVIKK